MRIAGIRRSCALTAREWRLLWVACATLAATRLALRLRPRATVVSVLAGALSPCGARMDERRVAAVVTAVERAVRLSRSSPRCLPRAVALCRMLRRAGEPAAVRIGVRRDGGALVAHAWVECAGRVVGDRADVGDEFPALAPAAALPPGMPIEVVGGAATR